MAKANWTLRIHDVDPSSDKLTMNGETCLSMIQSSKHIRGGATNEVPIFRICTRPRSSLGKMHDKVAGSSVCSTGTKKLRLSHATEMGKSD